MCCLGVLLIACQAWAAQSKPFQGFTKYKWYRADYQVNSNGTAVETYSWAQQVLTQRGLSEANRGSVSFSDRLANAKILYAYTLKKDGRRINVPPSNFQIESNSGKGSHSPLFSDIKTITIAFPDLAVGDTVVMAYRLTEKKAQYPGNFSMLESFSKFEVYDKVNVNLNAPDSLKLYVHSRGVEGGEAPSKDGHHYWRWSYHNDQVANYEPAAVSSLDYGPLIVATTFKNYGALATAYNARAAATARVTANTRKLATAVTKGLTSPREQARALYEWVATNIQYAANDVGVGSVVPHDADLVLANRMGDCKDHVTLLQSLLAARGITSTPALINASDAYMLPPVVAPAIFDHVVTYIPSLKLYADATSRFTPFGTLPLADADKPVVYTVNFPGLRHTPPTDYRHNGGSFTTTLNIKSDGSADGTTTIVAHGIWATILRATMKYIPPNMHDQLMRSLLTHNGYSGTGTIEGSGADFSGTYTLTSHYRLSDVINLPGPGAVFLRSPLGSLGGIPAILSSANGPKPTVNYRCMGGIMQEHFTLHLPEGVKLLAVPKNAEFAGADASYKAAYTTSGDTVTAVRDFEDRTAQNVCTPAEVMAFRSFLKQVRHDVHSQVLYQ